MSRRPDGWTYGPYDRGGTPEDRTVVLPQGAPPGQRAPGHGAGQPTYPAYPRYPGYDPRQPPEPPPRRRRWGRRILAFLVVLLLAVVGLAVFADQRFNRVQALEDYPGRPAATPGTDWLIVGSDSREGLSAAEKQRLATGDAPGQRTDTIMLLHIPRAGQPVLVSLPRDSYVPIPGRGRQRINAAFALGGPKLLVRTVEGVTGIRIDHYMEIGFGGFAQLVDAVGGVRICADKAIDDPKAGLKLKAGCQVMNGRKALGYVRTRATAKGDLDRVERQQQFMGALIDKATSPGVLLNPLRSVPLLLDGPEALTIDKRDHIHHLARFGLAMRDISRGEGVKTTVPVRGNATVGGAAVLLWDRDRALALFNALKADRPVNNIIQQQP